MPQTLIGLGVSEDDGVTVVKVTGCVDLATAPALASTLDCRPRTGLVVDLTGVEFMDSTGISALLTAQKAAAAVLVVTAGPVAELLELTAMGEIFPITESVAQARKLLEG